MSIPIKEIVELLEQAEKTQRDLHLVINTDGTYEFDFTIPSKTVISSTYEPTHDVLGKFNPIDMEKNNV